jgi:hypothetical protein
MTAPHRRYPALSGGGGSELESTSYLQAVAALCTDRLLVPWWPRPRMGEVTGGLVSDKAAEMTVVLLQSHDGRRALPAFTGLDALQAAARRPAGAVTSTSPPEYPSEAAAPADRLAGPHQLTIEALLDELAAGHRLVELGPDEFGWPCRGASLGCDRFSHRAGSASGDPISHPSDTSALVAGFVGGGDLSHSVMSGSSHARGPVCV